MSDLAFRSFTTTLHFTRGAVGGSRPGSNVNKPTCMVTRVHVIGFIMCGKFYSFANTLIHYSVQCPTDYI